jgi:hypothetical protein
MSHLRPREDLRFFPEEARQEELKRRIEEELRRPFHLSRPPLVRWRLYQLDEQKYCLLHTEHHFVHDGWSYGAFLDELYATYAALVSGESLANEPEPVQFADFAIWQREMIAPGVWDHQLDYWRKELAGCPPPPLLPSDRRLGRQRNFEGSQIRHPIPETLWRELGQACSREGVTRFAWIQAVFHLFINHYTGADDFCTGTGFANRRDPRFHKMLGMVINTLPIRAHFERIATFRDLLRRTQERLRFALDNQELPFEIVVKDLNPGRDANNNPFFNAFVACYDTAYPVFADQGLKISSEDGISCGQVKFDLGAPTRAACGAPFAGAECASAYLGIQHRTLRFLDRQTHAQSFSWSSREQHLPARRPRWQFVHGSGGRSEPDFGLRERSRVSAAV